MSADETMDLMPAVWIPCDACGDDYEVGFPARGLCPDCQKANDEALNPAPASVFDEPKFLEWANEKVSQMPVTDFAWSWYVTTMSGPATWYLHLLAGKRGFYDTTADVAQAYVDRKKNR